MVKCNVDCALFNNNSSPLEAEALGLFEAIKIAINCNMTSVIFESDCRFLVDTLNSNSTPKNEFGDIFLDVSIYCHLAIILL